MNGWADDVGNRTVFKPSPLQRLKEEALAGAIESAGARGATPHEVTAVPRAAPPPEPVRPPPVVDPVAPPAAPRPPRQDGLHDLTVISFAPLEIPEAPPTPSVEAAAARKPASPAVAPDVPAGSRRSPVWLILLLVAAAALLMVLLYSQGRG